MKSKPVIIVSLILSAIFLLFFVSVGYCEQEVKVMINGRLIEQEAKLIDGRTYLPIRAVGEALGAEVSSNSAQMRLYKADSTFLFYTQGHNGFLLQ